MNDVPKQVSSNLIDRSSSLLHAKRLQFIDALRGIAVFAVLSVHTAHLTKGLPHPLEEILNQGVRGVQLFFVISAFTLFRSLNYRKETEKRPNLNFFVRRFFRIAPMFYCAAVFYLFRDGFGPRYWLGDQPSITFWNILANISFTNGWNPYWLNSVVPGGWSVAAEMLFYLTVPFLFSKIKTLKSAIWLTIVASILSKALFFVLPKFPLIASRELWEHFTFLWLPNQFPVFCLGIVLYFLIENNVLNNLSKSSKRKTASIFLGLAIAAMLIFAFRCPVIPVHIGYSICFTLLSLALSLHPSGLFVNPFWCYLGKVSFSTYLTHFIMLPFAANLIQYVHLSPVVDYVFALFLVLIGSLIISSFTYNFIEVPGQFAGKILIAKLEQASG